MRDSRCDGNASQSVSSRNCRLPTYLYSPKMNFICIPSFKHPNIYLARTDGFSTLCTHELYRASNSVLIRFATASSCPLIFSSQLLFLSQLGTTSLAQAQREENKTPFSISLLFILVFKGIPSCIE